MLHGTMPYDLQHYAVGLPAGEGFWKHPVKHVGQAHPVTHVIKEDGSGVCVEKDAWIKFEKDGMIRE